MGNGKRKIEIKKIDNLQARNVCFSKRRKGIFKKAYDLSRVDPNIRIAAVVFSPAGNPFVYGDPLALSSINDAEEPKTISQSTIAFSKPDDQLLKIKNMVSLDCSNMRLDELRKYAEELKAARTELAMCIDQHKELMMKESSSDDVASASASSIVTPCTSNMSGMMMMSDSEVEAMVEELLHVGDSENGNNWTGCSNATVTDENDCFAIDDYDNAFDADEFLTQLLSMA